MRWADLDLNQREWRIPITKNREPLSVPLVPEAVVILSQRLKTAADDAMFVFPAARSDSKLGYMSGERKAWLRILDRDELTQLKQRIEAAGHSFESDPTETLDKALARARREAKQLRVKMDGARLEDVRIHDLRRTLGSWQARTGASMVIIGKSLGHKSQQATAVYARLDLDPVRESMERATSAMLVAGGVKPAADVDNLKARTAKR
jgi:integrase